MTGGGIANDGSLRSYWGGLSTLVASLIDVEPPLHNANQMRAFGKSVFMGTLAGAWMPLLFTILIAFNTLPEGLNGDGNIWSSVWLAVSPLAVTLAFVLPASLAIGLPATAVLKASNAESMAAYTVLGIVVGFALPLAVLYMMDAQDGWWLSFLGMFSGGVTARTWWASRSELSEN